MLKLSMLKPSPNSMTVRIFLRASGLPYEEADVWGHTRSPEYLAKCPAHMTPMLECDGLPKQAMWESCAIMQYLCNMHGLTKFYPTDPAKRAMIDSAMFYHTGTLYPLISRGAVWFEFFRNMYLIGAITIKHFYLVTYHHMQVSI